MKHPEELDLNQILLAPRDKEISRATQSNIRRHVMETIFNGLLETTWERIGNQVNAGVGWPFIQTATRARR